MPHIIRTQDLYGLQADFMKEVYQLQAIWNDQQYQYFFNHYAEPLARDLKDMEDKVSYYLDHLRQKQLELESL